MRWTIQASFHQLEELKDILQSESVLLEISDFAFPHNFSLEGENLVDAWDEYSHRNRIAGLHGSFLDLIMHSVDPQISQLSQKRYLWNLGIADRLGTNYTIFHSNYQALRTNKGYLSRWIKTHSDFIKQYQEIYTSHIVLEPQYDPGPQLLLALRQQVPDLKVCLDVGYASWYSKISIESWFEQLGESIHVVHMKDFATTGDELALGDGSLNYSKILEMIEEYCDNPYVVLEMEIPAILKSLKRLDL